MCLIVFAVNSHPYYKLILLANRDEFFNRETVEAHFWNDHPNVIGGIDKKAGGTWLGITTAGKIAAITNFREGFRENNNLISRGNLTKDFLISNFNNESYLEFLEANKARYNEYNLIYGNVDKLSYYSNKGKKIDQIGKGIFGLSNNFLNVPWYKVERSKRLLSELLKDKDIIEEDLLSMMKDSSCPTDKDLPDTGIGLNYERLLSSMYISLPDYGTRSTSLITVNYNNLCSFTERIYKHSDNSHRDINFIFELENENN